MAGPGTASVVRVGEHACLRLRQAEDRGAIVGAFIRRGLDDGHKVVVLGNDDQARGTIEDLTAGDHVIAAAYHRGRLALRPALETYAAHGAFDPEEMIGVIRQEHRAALAAGYPALSLTGEMTCALCGTPGGERLSQYERLLDEYDGRRTLLLLCQYDQARFAPGVLDELAAAHAVDVSPELAAIGRTGRLAAARTATGLRLAGELDYDGAEALAAVLDARFHGALELDLADLEYVDAAGMRALRGRKAQRLTITAASATVRRLLALMAWDADPHIEIAKPASRGTGPTGPAFASRMARRRAHARASPASPGRSAGTAPSR